MEENMTLKNIVLAVELFENEQPLIKKALEFAARFKAKITLVHAIEHVITYGASYGVAVGVEVEEALLKSANKLMHKLGKKLKIAEKNQVIKFGSAKEVVVEEAKRVKADLIIVGSHGRHGMRLLLGSTANAVLHNATCDVLAVRIKG
jgi:universal stress protein A